ncbi:arginine biosynthesis bifunctional protein ArgJ [Methylocystaceae bacterium]|nr:arginine biosynthesis bifunctional protein ArgJ [Methylocystaceae bacterium]
MPQTSTPSPLAPKTMPLIAPLEGVRFATGAVGIRYADRPDVMLALLDEGATVAGVFTKSKCPSAPVEWCRAKLKSGKARALLVNSGNANAFTGKAGDQAVKLSAQLLAQAAGVKEKHIFIASTGVIGEPLDANKFQGKLTPLIEQAKPEYWEQAARAIMTTDTFPKLATRKAVISGVEVTLSGFAKGAGMIAPDMATMLAFIFTDAWIDAKVLQILLTNATQGTFNSITVDSDTSTSDSLLFFATGAARARGLEKIDRSRDNNLADFKRALNELMLDLAQQIVKDGEGARKFIEIQINGASTSRSAKKVALSIANSPLVKTAIAGEDANWGRVVMAVGKAGEKADRDRLSIWFGDIRVAHKGLRDPNYNEAEVSQLMQKDLIIIKVDLGIGEGTAKVWTCDLTKEYIAINGDYRS